MINLSNPVWKDSQFPHFYYNEKHLEPFEVRLKNKFKMLNFLGDFGDVAVSEMLENSAIEGVMLSLDKLTSSYLGHVVGPSGKRENIAVAAMKMAIENFDSPSQMSLSRNWIVYLTSFHSVVNTSAECISFKAAELIEW